MTDIEGSTAAWEANERATRDALTVLDREVVRAVDSHGGVLIKDRGEGDSHFSVFARAPDAVAAALDFQLAIADFPYAVRVAVHTGTAELRDDDYYGPAVNRCARLRAIGHGGQVLLSEATAALVRDHLPSGAWLVDLGTHRLRDLTRPEEVAQLCHAALREQFPPLRSLDMVRHNLPVQLTSFVGREPELTAVGDLVRAHRLVTIAGPGGAGKTRLALQAAADLLDQFPSGVWFVDLASVTDGEDVVGALVLALGLDRQPGSDPMEVVRSRLKNANSLVVLDNCEHVIDAAAGLAAEVLEAAPGVAILATSREALGIAGEALWRVTPMGSPDPSALPALEAMTQYEAVRLFVDRAVMAKPSFAVTNSNAPAVAEVCHRLEGIPLAIELAAARTRMMTPHQILHRLGDVFGLLSGGARRTTPRQQTLRAAIDWSHDLLAEEERALFRRLAAFPGAATLEAIEQVCTDRAPGLDLVTALLDKSLITAVETVDDQIRYGMLSTIRTYAQEVLASSGEELEVRDRHLFWVTEQAGAVIGATDIRSAGWRCLWPKAWCQENVEDIDHALTWALRRDDPSGWARLLEPVARATWDPRLLKWLDHNLLRDERITVQTRLSLAVRRVLVRRYQGRQEDHSPVDEALELADAVDDPDARCNALLACADWEGRVGDDEARHRLRSEALEVAVSTASPGVLVDTYRAAALHVRSTEDPDAERRLLMEALGVQQRDPELRKDPYVLIDLAWHALLQGDEAGYVRLNEEYLSLAPRTGDHVLRVLLLMQLDARRAGDLTRASALERERLARLDAIEPPEAQAAARVELGHTRAVPAA